MKTLLPLLSPKSSYRSQPQKAVPVLALQNSGEGIDYLLASPQGKSWKIESCGVWTTTSVPNGSTSIWDEFFAQGWKELGQVAENTPSRKLLLCLRRPEFEFHSLKVMEVEGVDFTEQVQNQIAIQERLEPEQWLIDYATYPADANGERTTFVASIARDVWDRWQESWRSSKSKLTNVVPRTWALLNLVESQSVLDDQAILLLGLYRKQADLVVLVQRRPIFVRSINLQQPDDPASVAQQLLSEIRLTAGTIDLPATDQSVSHAVIVGEQEFAEAMANSLEDTLEISTRVLTVEGLAGFQFGAKEVVSAEMLPLLGLLSGFTKTPDLEMIDLMNPKLMIRPPSRWRLYGWIAALLLVGLGYWTYDVWQTYDTNQQAIQEQSSKLKEARAALDRAVPRAQVSRFVQQWDAEKVDWLRQLDEITRRLPSGDDVVVRQYDGKRTATGADIAMQIQVRNLEAIAAIEQAIRDSGWKLQFPRVVETQDPAFPFRLESNVSYTQDAQSDAGE